MFSFTRFLTGRASNPGKWIKPSTVKHQLTYRKRTIVSSALNNLRTAKVNIPGINALPKDNVVRVGELHDWAARVTNEYEKSIEEKLK